jgi:hypothetical protein
MSAPTKAIAAAQAAWQLLARLEPPDIGDTLASLTVAWIDAVAGSDPRARAAVFEAFTGAIADGLERRDAMVAGHD